MGRYIAGAVLVLALLYMTAPAFGQMFPMGFGFPNVVHTASSTAWQHDTADALDYENFHMVPMGLGFPAIHSTSLHVQSMSHTEFSQTSEFTAIGCPYASMGCGPFGGFGRGF